MLLDEFMPRWDFCERHQGLARAAPRDAFEAAWELDMARSPVTRALLRLRELPYRLLKRDVASKGFGSTMADMFELGFILLARQEPHEFVFGLVGRFWSLDFCMEKLTPQQFKTFAEPGNAMVAANLRFEPRGEGLTRLYTETRVRCLGPRAKRGFRRYWTVIRPFSGLIRREWLRVIRNEAEARARERLINGA